MNCDVCRKVIPVYRELGITEQKNVDEHITQCVACKQLFAQHALFEELVRKAANTQQQHAHPEFIKQQILKSIRQGSIPARNHSWSLTEGFNFAWARIALYSLSAFMVITFFLEVNNKPYTAHSKPIETNSIIINANTIRESFSKRDREKSLLTPTCIASLGHTDINCLKSKLKTIPYEVQ